MGLIDDNNGTLFVAAITIKSLFFLMTDYTKVDVTVLVYELYPVNELCQTPHQTAFVQRSYF